MSEIELITPEVELQELKELHQALAAHLHSYYRKGTPMVSIRQVMDILTGRAPAAAFNSALQVRPTRGVEW